MHQRSHNWSLWPSGMVLAFCLAILFHSDSPAGAEITVRFAPSRQPFESIKNGLAEAQSSIDVAIYSFSDRRLRDAIIAAAKRGVRIRIILNKAKSYTAFANALEKAHVDVRYVNTVMHHKFVVIDGPQTASDDPAKGVLLSGSCNWTSSAFARYDEDLFHATGEPDMLKAFQREFDLLWGHSREFGKTIYKAMTPQKGKLPAKREAPVLFTSDNMRAYEYRGEKSFGPAVELERGVCGRCLVAAINAARESIWIAATHYRRADIDKALRQAHKRGVAIRLLLDGQEFHGGPTQIPNARHDEELAEQGVPVRYKTYSRKWDYRTARQMHCKYMIVDSREVLTGSLNWSANSELKTMENLVTLKDRRVIDAYRKKFETMWNYGDGKLGPLIQKIKTGKGRRPQSFAPMSLDVEQLQRLHAAYDKPRQK